MKLRKIVSLTAMLSFLLMLLSTIVLYIVPQGRVAYWADWRLWGLSKTGWTEIHINLGLLFLITGFLHIYLNWGPLVRYMKDRASRFRLFTPDFSAAAALTALFVLGTYFHVPPLDWVLQLNIRVKDAAAVTYGEPPYGHAELSSLKTFAQKAGLDLGRAKELLQKAGIRVEGENQTLETIAAANGLSPQQIFEFMRGAAVPPAVAQGLPESPPPGIGGRTLADICQEYEIAIPSLLRALDTLGLTVTAESTLKNIAESHRKDPHEVYGMLRKAIGDLEKSG